MAKAKRAQVSTTGVENGEGRFRMLRLASESTQSAFRGSPNNTKVRTYVQIKLLDAKVRVQVVHAHELVVVQPKNLKVGLRRGKNVR